ncbi:gliding motility lipoprotein GldK [Bacteroidia bacterium]|nr:gliding motility lipoprotein GldK [Bacteroidia bacterium]
MKMIMQMKRVLLIIIVAVLASCSPFGGGGELIGTRKEKKWFEPKPFGMVSIPAGSLTIGQNDEDISWSLNANSKTISVPAFWMDDTEITNDEYRQFVSWVLDSMRRQRLADDGHDEFLLKDKSGTPIEPALLNYKTPIAGKKKAEYAESLAALEYAGDDRIGGGEIDCRKLAYNMSYYDFRQAALNDQFYDKTKDEYVGGSAVNANGEREAIKGRSSFIIRKVVRIYPDTLCWLKDYTFAYNDPYVRNYFSHVGYDNYPVVGVNWNQADAFCNWRNRIYEKSKNPKVEQWRLPSEAEWEYAARGGLVAQKYPWGGAYIANRKGCFVANFKPRRGDYIRDGGMITVPVGSYEPNGYGLYDMAGNVSEWTYDSYNESIYAIAGDMAPTYQATFKLDNNMSKRKVVRGGSWKDVAYFLQNGVRGFEYQDSTRCYIGFRAVRTKIEF